VIFGFNSDVKHDETVYHVQSEVRQREQLLETQVFVQGRCIGKSGSVFSSSSGESASEQQLHELLKLQHREVLDAIRAGEVQNLFVPPSELKLTWIEAQAVPAENRVQATFRVLACNRPVAGAQVRARVDAPTGHTAFVELQTDLEGSGQLHLELPGDLIAGAILTVQTSHRGRTLRARYQLCKAD